MQREVGAETMRCTICGDHHPAVQRRDGSLVASSCQDTPTPELAHEVGQPKADDLFTNREHGIEDDDSDDEDSDFD